MLLQQGSCTLLQLLNMETKYLWMLIKEASLSFIFFKIVKMFKESFLSIFFCVAVF